MLGTQKKMSELSLLGETLKDLTLEDIKRYQGESGFFRKLINGIRFFKVRTTDKEKYGLQMV